MKYTNSQNLPKAFYDMATKNELVLGEKIYRVTTLLKGEKEILLEKRHDLELEKDIASMVWMLFGTAVHEILEQQEEADDELKETRLEIEVDGYKVTGKFDLYNAKTKTISDYKTCSIFKVLKEDYTDWRKQLLIYAYMLRSIGFEVDKGEIVAIMKDHSLSKAKYDRTYPQNPVQKITFKFYEDDYKEIEEFLKNKIATLKALENTPDDDIPPCTEKERWAKETKYAVMKNGRKTALRVLDSEEDAKSYIATNGGDYIEKRLGENTKCASYCTACEFCNFYQEHVKGVANGNMESN